MAVSLLSVLKVVKAARNHFPHVLETGAAGSQLRGPQLLTRQPTHHIIPNQPHSCQMPVSVESKLFFMVETVGNSPRGDPSGHGRPHNCIGFPQFVRRRGSGPMVRHGNGQLTRSRNRTTRKSLREMTRKELARLAQRQFRSPVGTRCGSPSWSTLCSRQHSKPEDSEKQLETIL